MEKRLRSSLQNSVESFFSTATELSLKSAKPSLKTIIHNVKPSSDLSSALPLCLHTAIDNSINSFKNFQNPTTPRTPPSPPTKRPRRSSRNSRSQNQSTQETKETKQTCILQNLQLYAYIALLCITHPKRAFSPEDLLPSAIELHDNLILFELDSALLSEIATLCEQWWKEGFVGKEMLISQLLPFLVSKSLTLRKKVDVHRVYMLREAFELFDFEDESIEDLKLLLIRCLIAPLYLKMEDGRRFIAFTFRLSLQLLKEGLAMIRSQIPFGRKSVLEAYGDIVFRGWKSVEGDLKREIEDGFLQGLIEGAILANSPSFAASIRRVLGGFINQRTSDGVEKLLFRMAEPVIFRSLQVANSNVRQNALHLLLDMFPLDDPDATKVVKDTLLDKQFFLLERLLTDDCPDVRVVAVEGCCRVLHLFWEVIPSSTITKILTKIFDDMSHDVSNEVRLSTLNGIIYLLGNPQSHEILKVLLPRLGHMILDAVLSVRLAVTDLLFLLSNIRGFQFHKVVNLDVLLQTLTNDKPLVAQRITRLLMPSYFPSKVCPAEACSRFVTLVKRSPLAGARFCEFAASEGAATKSLMELVRVLINMTLSPDNLDAAQIDGMLVAAAQLCNSLASEATCKEALKKLLSGEKLKALLDVAGSGNAQSSPFNMAYVVSPPGLDGLLKECIGLVANSGDLSGNIERQGKVRSAHKLILSYDWFEDMFEALTSLLQSTALVCHNNFSTELPRQVFPTAKRKKSRSVQFSVRCKSVKRPSTFKENYQIAVGIAWQIKDLLISEVSRRSILESEALERAFLALKIISEVSIAHCMCCDFMDSSLVAAYTALSLHVALQDVTVDGIDSHSNMSNFGPSSTASSPAASWTSLDQTTDHLLRHAEKAFQVAVWAKPRSPSLECKQCSNVEANCSRRKPVGSHVDASTVEDDEYVSTYGKRMTNLLKILTSILKFIVDAATLGLLPGHQQRFLKFASAYLQNVVTNLRQSTHDELQLQEEQMREMLICYKSSFSYAAKLLNTVLARVDEDFPAPLELHTVANNLLDLTVSVELYFGFGCASRLTTVAKDWLPDLILALGSKCLLKHSAEEVTSLQESPDTEICIPSWLSVLAEIEICELRSSACSDEEDGRNTEQSIFPAFKKLIGMMVPLLRENLNVLDVVGLQFLVCSMNGLRRKDFSLVLGLTCFIFVRLLRPEDREFGKLRLMMMYVQEEMYPRIESEADGSRSSEDGLSELLEVKALLEPLVRNDRRTSGS
ncbi:hypothetical protein Nepgr_016681 [Nepenthes gracilis]|uniref:Condensin-2 complex subunit G2 n=1 Tax=Nepenthes gracilis TaxID=150966 RepID=A0AAD3SN26_NEPGR|nr:hypothetical protein Nepgr_016681 [Nepenthes gracilis]